MSMEPELLRCAGAGDFAGLSRLLDGGAKPDEPGAGGDTALMRAAARGHASIISQLLARGAAVDAASAVGNTALMFAAASGQVAAVRLLLDHGASPGHRNKYGLGAADWAKWSDRQEEILGFLGVEPTR
jgi:ankyrin repeat protein